MSEHDTLSDLLDLDLEYRLTVAIRISSGEECDCAEYLVNRRAVLIPEVMLGAAEKGEEPTDYFAAFARRLHARHEEGDRA